MPATREQIVTAAERTFDRHGFAATGVDRLTDAVGISSRTLYKQFDGKTAITVAVLEARMERALARWEVSTISALFCALLDWSERHGARGCLFFRAMSEAGTRAPEIARTVAEYQSRLRLLISRIIETERGSPDEELAEQVLVLFEGATAAASYRGTAAITAAGAAAAVLLSTREQDAE